MMKRFQIQGRIKELRDELEIRYKYGTIKMADDNGKPISSDLLQKELYSLIYKLSKID